MAGDAFSKGRSVPTGRVNRFAKMGGLATGLAGGMAVAGAQALARGQRPRAADMLMTPANMARFANHMAEMRGAAMKIGQLLSMEAGDLLPPELETILARLRSQAHVMPPAQLKLVLRTAYGDEFRALFRSFDSRPLAAASIGQVHRATANDGARLALKLQYPGVRQAIDSDVANAAALIRWSGLLPGDLDIAPLLEEARQQLHDEADYLREAKAMDRFRRLLSDDPRFVVPQPRHDLSRPDALAMSFEAAAPIESLSDEPPPVRDAAIAALIELCLAELFRFQTMQSDPNFANYRWRSETQQIVLLDFGATRSIPEPLAHGHLALLCAGLDGDRSDVLHALEALGFIRPDLSAEHQATLLDMADMGFDLLRQSGPFDFRDNTFADEMRRRGQAIGTERDLWHIPPAQTLFVQRKIGGLYLLAARIGAQVDIAHLARTAAGQGVGPAP